MTGEVHKLGEVLRAAREAKGVDLTRVERETKIRERYLSALEAGDYRDLPGSVYTKGFLRNYGTYLGLDPEYLIDLYRLETSAPAVEKPRIAPPPRPIAGRRSRAFVLTPGVIVAAVLTVLVGGFVAYLGYEFVNFARTPELRITDPAGNVTGYTELTITVRGTTAPNARVTVANLRENPTVEADADGTFEMTVGLVPGSNVMRLTATDPVTGRDSEVEERTIVVVSDVASPSPGVAALTVTAPEADATFQGPVAVGGTATPGASVQVGATLVSVGEPTFTITDPAGAPVAVEPVEPRAPDPTTLTADDAGAFSGELSLLAGEWDIAVSTEGVDPVTRRVVVAPGGGLHGSLAVVDGESYLEVEQDGAPVDDVSGTIAPEGTRVTLAADESLRIRAGNAGAVRISLNGIGLGAIGEDGEVIEWRISRSGG
ncbi:MAG TPA: RodZ domain-containing protein [Candidatus Limnocylindria bacterium]|nr:RodZ domain-containing protein [Candidatus Limnocylindria bacterium]